MLSKALLAIVSLFPLSVAFGQQVDTSINPCKSPEVTAFDFHVGTWQQIDGPAIHEVKKILNGCVIEEIWKGGGTGDAVALKSYDKSAQRWYLSWVSGALIHQLWEGRLESGQWRFYRTWMLDGKPMLSRTYWTSRSNDQIERIVEQSPDGGKTWRPHVQAVYRRKSD